MKDVIKTAVFFVIGAVILYLIFNNQSIAYQEQCALDGISEENCSLVEKIWGDFKGANWGIIAIILFLFMVSNVSRAIRWQMLLEPVTGKPRFHNAIGSVMIGYLVNLGVPRSGEFVRAGVLSKYEGFPAEKVMGTIVVDRIIDVISLLVVIGITFLVAFSDMKELLDTHLNLEEKFGGLLQSKGLWVSVVAGMIAVCGGLYYFRHKILNSSLGKKVYNILVGFLEGIKSVFRLRQPAWFLFHSIVIWLMYYLMTYIAFYAYGPTAHLGPVAGLVVFVFGTLGIVFPSPGGMGTYHYLVSSGLILYGINSIEAFTFANIIFFSVQLFCNVLFGVLAFILLSYINKNVRIKK